MIDLLVKFAWTLLAAIHLPPATVLVAPRLVRDLYGIDAAGDLGVLLTHRGALFLAVVVGCLYAAVEPNARRAVGLIALISVLSFLVIYGRAGMPPGPLRTIAMADLIALVPLSIVCWNAWWAQAQ